MQKSITLDPVTALLFAAFAVLPMLLNCVITLAFPTVMGSVSGTALLVSFCVAEAELYGLTYLAYAVRGGPHYYAVRRGDIAGFHLAISQGCKLAEKTCFGETLLHLAARFGRAEIAKFLLDAGFSPDCADRSGRTPRSIAMQKGHSQMIRLFKEFDVQCSQLVSG